MHACVIVPWRGGCPHREAALEWVRARYAIRHPDWHVSATEFGRGPWSKGRALYAAVRAVEGRVLVVADADVWCDTTAEAVQAVNGGAPWAMPHRRVRRLSATQTAAVLAGVEPAVAGAADAGLAEPPHPAAVGGGIVVLPRQAATHVPIDPRFEGWGSEDHAWGHALSTLLGPPWRGNAVLWHLWHPPQQRINRTIGNRANQRLGKRYARASRRPTLMERLAEEARHAGGAAPQ